MLKKLRNKLVKILSFPFNLIFFTIPFFLETIIFKLFKNKKITISDELNKKMIFLVNSKSGKSFGKVLPAVLKTYYNAKNICDITQLDYILFIESLTESIRNKSKVKCLFTKENIK